MNDTPPGVNEWSGVVRLAAVLGDRAAAAALLGPAVAAWDYGYNRAPSTTPDAYVASEALAAMSAVVGM